tara:strand:+ start:173 stop:733 length:561 start_codon:yes stop_codon:yes gene_type:complete
MRIIGGIYRGKKITLPEDKKTRPLKDIVKESIFNLIEHSNKFKIEIKNSLVLDLFAGSGSFGLECISRGAKKVVFIENYSKILNILKRNINSINATKNTNIIEKNCFDYLLENNQFQKKFNLIFLDPPYKEKRINVLIDKIKENEFLKDDGIIIVHRHKKNNLIISKKIDILDERIYGISKITIAN